MNKYQEALSSITEPYTRMHIDEKDIEALQELVDKATPKQVTRTYVLVNQNKYGECPNCGHSGLQAIMHQCCWWCGQSLDWSEQGE